jgi:hypothetical protein
MKRLLNSRKFATISFVVLVYCLSILIEKRISPNNSFDFLLWSPYYLLLAILIPAILILPLKIFPKSKYSVLIFKKERILKSVTIISTVILVLWLLLWYTMSGFGKILDKSLNKSEADEISIAYLKNDPYIHKKIGNLDSLKQISYTISSTEAKFDFRVYGSDSIINSEVFLTRGQNWIVDTIIIK